MKFRQHLDVDIVALERLCCACGCHYLKAEIRELLGDEYDISLILVLDAYEYITFCRKLLSRGYLALCVSAPECRVYTHHFSGRFHFRPEDGIHSREPYERKYRLLHRYKVYGLLFCEAELFQRLAQHYLCSEICQRNTDGLTHERYCSRRPGIDFQYIDYIVLYGILYIHQAFHIKLFGHSVSVLLYDLYYIFA